MAVTPSPTVTLVMYCVQRYHGMGYVADISPSPVIASTPVSVSRLHATFSPHTPLNVSAPTVSEKMQTVSATIIANEIINKSFLIFISSLRNI